MADVLERGNIYFAYRPKVEHTSAEGLEDIQRFFVILSPFGKERHRRSSSSARSIAGDQERNWGFVQKVGREPEESEDELGVRLDPQHETIKTAELFNDLRMERTSHPLKPLFEGRWR